MTAVNNCSARLDMAADAIKQRGMQWVVRLRAKSAAPVARSPERGKESASSAQPSAAASNASSDAAANASVSVENLTDTAMLRDCRI